MRKDATINSVRFMQLRRLVSGLGSRAPVLAYSIGDDKRGRPAAVDAMMQAYPNLERRHIEPADASMDSIGHMGFFKQEASHLWPELITWMHEQ